ncbi:MAG: hypothetical protein K9L24_00680 [Spirochaetia bacterium]|nr:hypothetical protein [Spirochaetia bacterium]
MLTLIIRMRTFVRYGRLLRHGRSGLHLFICDEQGNELREGTPEYYDLALAYLYASLYEYYTRHTSKWKFWKRVKIDANDTLDSVQETDIQLEFDF